MSKRVGKRKSGRGFLNTLINKLPVEWHIPGYNFCGPGTKLQQRLNRGDIGINKLDEACKLHDIAYAKYVDAPSRHAADLDLANTAWQRFKSWDASAGERAAALLITNIMKGKVKMGAALKDKCISVKNLPIAVKPKIKKTKCVRSDRKIKVPKKHGGILPLLPMIAALGALGSVAGGGAAIARAVKSASNEKKQLQEAQRHNKTMESIALGKKRGAGLLPNPLVSSLLAAISTPLVGKKIHAAFKKITGKGLYMRPFVPRGSGLKKTVFKSKQKKKVVKIKKKP